jgi:tRNA (guanine-N7-)-methyltransferase
LPTNSKRDSADPARPASEESARRRTIYGRRLGLPLKQGREKALAAWLPRLGITVPEQGRLDPAKLFATPVEDVWLEVGFGSGEHLLAQAAAHPHIGLIGCEPFVNGMAALLAEIAREPARAANIRVLMDDARPLIAALPDACLGRVFVLFPDPWPKVRHHKRRFIAPATLDELARVLRPGAELRVASDDEGYIEWVLEHVPPHEAFEPLRTDSEWRQRPADWPPTRYEAKARARGRAPAFFAFRRRQA